MHTTNSIPDSSRSRENLALPDAERQLLIDNIAILVVQWHRRQQQESSESNHQPVAPPYSIPATR